MLTLFNFSGVPEVLSSLFENDSDRYAYCEEEEEEGKEDNKEKEEKEKEKEDIKESLLSDNISFYSALSGRALEIQNRVLRDSGYYPEDHCPPPELV